MLRSVSVEFGGLSDKARGDLGDREGDQSMKRVITLALLMFGLAVFTTGPGFSKTPQGKDGKQILLKATASPGSLDFGDQVVQTLSKQLRVTLKNTNDRTIQISRVDTGEGHWEDFEADDDACTGVPIEAGQSCSIGVIFSPGGVGARKAFLLITYDDEDHPQKISLKGNGIKQSTVTP
jgi:hypothetical protein